MKSYRQALFHIVFATKSRKPILAGDSRERLYRYIGGYLQE